MHHHKKNPGRKLFQYS